MDYIRFKELIPWCDMEEEQFRFYDEKALAALASHTFGRSACFDEAQAAEAELCCLYYENRAREGIASESNDGMSVSYSYDEKKSEREIVRRWLGNTGLLYAGVEKRRRV